jgi:integrase
MDKKQRIRKRRGRGEGGIYQRGDGRWVGSISMGCTGDGKRKRRVIYGGTKQEVQTKIRKLYDAATVPRELAALSIEGYLTRWLELVKPTVEFGTYKPYKHHVVNHIVPIIGGLKLVELKRFHVEEMYAALAKKEVSPAMQRKIGTTLTIALGAAVDKEMIPFNPAERVRKPKAVKPEIQPLDVDQVSAFLKAAKEDRLYAFFVTALDTGARPGELFALYWRDIDFEHGRLTIKKSLAPDEHGKLQLKDVKTKKARRQIRLAQVTLVALEDHRKRMMAEGHSSSPVFCNTVGNYIHLKDLHRKSFRPILTKACLPGIRLYDLRHTCATLLLLAGENAKVVSERLGHATIVMTLDVYSHVLEGMQEQAAIKMDRILSYQPKKTETA